MGFVGELMALEVEDKLRGFLGVKPTKTSNGLFGDGEMDERGISVCSLQSLSDIPKNNSDRPLREP